MAPKRAQYITYGDDDLCTETRQFIEEAGVLLDVRDISKNPLSEEELSNLIGHIKITHFLNTLSDSYKKYRLDKHLPSRDDILRLMAKDYTLLRKPIIKSSRLLTIGFDRRKISDMLLINSDGHLSESNSIRNVAQRTTKVRRRHSTTASK